MRRSGVRFLFPAPVRIQAASKKPAYTQVTRVFAFGSLFALPVDRHPPFASFADALLQRSLTPFTRLRFKPEIAAANFTFAPRACLIRALCALSYNNKPFSASHHEASTQVSRYRYIHRGKATVQARDEGTQRRTKPDGASQAAIGSAENRSFCRSDIRGRHWITDA